MLAIPNKATTQGCLSSFKTPYIWREMVQVSYSVGVMFSSGKRMFKPLFMFGGKLKSGKCCLNLWVVSNIPNWEGNGISTDGQLWSRGDRWLKDIRFKWCNPQRETGKGWQQQRCCVVCILKDLFSCVCKLGNEEGNETVFISMGRTLKGLFRGEFQEDLQSQGNLLKSNLKSSSGPLWQQSTAT